MATPLTPDRLVEALRAEGVHVVERPGWRTHNRNHKGAWGPVNGVIVHHTVTSGTDASVSICENGYSELPGPLCHGVIDKDGTVYLIANGRANHAGRGDGDVLRAVIAETALPEPNDDDTDGNTHFYGFECVNLGDGKDPWPPAQLEAIERTSTAICRAHGWGAGSVIGHREWTSNKIDPAGFAMRDMRGRVAARLKGKPSGPVSTGGSKPSKPAGKPADGYLPPPFPDGLAPGKSSPSAKPLQEALKRTGWLEPSIPLSDNYGPATQKAVAGFNRKHNLFTTGQTYDPAIGRRGWALLHQLAYGN
ncbi:N-acetylmuramoyl-L-alanine amidase [Streptomyces mobaraensis]|uniref:peptidoglycan recognition protein family protein n=1 Tax=Streptomyces mobaraensis TaxID=35621 RepID=UPI00332007A4